MSKILFGPIITDSRGSQGGTTFTANRFGPSMRRRSSPRNPKSSRASLVRSRVAYFSQLWTTALDDSDRADWQTLADSYPVTDVYGNDYTLTGLQFFQRVNSRLAMAEIAPILTAPADQAVDPLATLSFAATSPATLTITFTVSPIGSTKSLYLFATPPLSPGITNFTPYLSFLLASAANASSTYAAGTAYAARFGSIRAGKRIYINAAILVRTTGALSLPLLTGAIAS